MDPVPDSVIQIVMRYRFRPDELVAGGNHLLGREWDEAITVLAVIKGFEGLEQTEQAAGQRTLFESLLNARLDVRQLEDTEQEICIQPRIM